MINIGWLVSTMIIIWTLFSQYNIGNKDYVMDVKALTNFVVFYQILWILAHCWIVFVCHTNNGGNVSFLRFRFLNFISFSKRIDRFLVRFFRRSEQIPFTPLVRRLQQDIVLVLFNPIRVFLLRCCYHQISGHVSDT